MRLAYRDRTGMPRFDPAELPARVLHRDADAIILDKPPGIAVHKGPGGGDDLEAHFDALRFGAPAAPALAHRLDKDTSGCLVLGRSKEALARLGKLFRDGRVAKTYWAVVAGPVAGDGGTIDAPLSRRSHDRRSWWMKVDPAGDPSCTDWRVLGRADGLAWLELRPRTGRTHQLRVHCAHLGAPIAGDRVYGGDVALAAARHLHLHARAVAYPWSGGTVSATAAPPAHMHALLEACGWSGSGP
jgi:tRNA pseudouridine32 synthase / 23S rRNA pseudouridine746 synthase